MGTIRRECLDYVIPLSEKHLRTILGSGVPTAIKDDLMRAWDPAFRILVVDRGRAQASIGMSCQPMAGLEHKIFSAGCTMNTGSKKLQREVGSTFCGAQ
jgi:hypothetical protein